MMQRVKRFEVGLAGIPLGSMGVLVKELGS